MPRMRPLIALSATLLMAFSTAVTADTLLFDYVGFDYESPDPIPSAFGEAGSSYIGIGTVPGLFFPIVADTSQNQYTYIVSGLTQVSTQAIGSFSVDFGSDAMLGIRFNSLPEPAPLGLVLMGLLGALLLPKRLRCA